MLLQSTRQCGFPWDPYLQVFKGSRGREEQEKEGRKNKERKAAILSMLHTVMQLSAASLTTSYSISFQPRRDRSTRTCSEDARASVTRVINCSRLSANPDPSPPKQNAALEKEKNNKELEGIRDREIEAEGSWREINLTITGKPILLAKLLASSTDRQAMLGAILSLISCNFSAKIPLSSVAMMLSMGVPNTLTPLLASTPYKSTS